ncbi:hypothetical protein Q7C_169 [Methylophaga frappieri]|uniref:Uncharacterized protein n=1 Tax=Methylophaga frappieri (strain ATCC BAA-2434 / DSM 25690 / JAM7) TaxID=754477 RepID=I1YEK7_METFJ|nr:hypothetical protein [Methylophaga frappieri]AFJ01350.1 hypothetical protein Q7C_169 [Methylophaga frappieri]
MNAIRLLLTTLCLSWAFSAAAEPTQIMVRAKAVDAKFIGTSVGGVKAVIEDAETGEILDTGWISGDTGDTAVLIKNPLERGQRQTTDTTAGYLATLDIETPRLVRISLFAPYGYRQSLQAASVTTWVIPGKPILGDGIILNMTGFIVDAWTQVLESGEVNIMTKAALLCGCPITHDGHWQADNYQATAIIMKEDKTITEVPMKFVGPVGMFRGKTTLTDPGHYKAIVTLYDKQHGNVGVDRSMFEVPAKK